MAVSVALSAHADEDELVDWLSGVPVAPPAVSIVHGEQVAADTLRRRLRDELGWHGSAPGMGRTSAIRAPRPGSVRAGP